MRNQLLSRATVALALCVVCTVCMLACQHKEPAPAAAPEHAEHAQPSPASSVCQPVQELASLDRRAPVPLQPMMAFHQKQSMMEHLVAIQRITDGLAREDWEQVASASALIESSPQMQQMCQHMGAGAQGFTEMALDFHRRADAIGEAARARDSAAALRATSNTLEACTACHASFRQELVSATQWQEHTAQAHDPESMHSHH